MSEQWNAWMLAAQQGDAIAYKSLLLAIRPWLKRYFSKRLPAAQVEDLVQDTLMSIHQKRQTYNPEYPFGPWLAAIARHRWIDHLRKQSRAHEVELFDTIASDDASDEGVYAHDLEIMLREIPEAQAQVIRLVKLEGCSIEEAAASTGHSVASVKVMIHRGMKRMMETAQKSEMSGDVMKEAS